MSWIPLLHACLKIEFPGGKSIELCGIYDLAEALSRAAGLAGENPNDWKVGEVKDGVMVPVRTDASELTLAQQIVARRFPASSHLSR